MKTCCACKVEKPFGDFHKNYKASDGLSSRCKPCGIQYAKTWVEKNPEKARATQHTWQKTNAKRKAITQKAWYDKNPDKVLAALLVREYGMSLEQWDELMLKQGGVCAVCSKEDACHKRLAVDHDHKTGAIRGLLCGKCNKAVGLFQDSSENCFEAGKYLNRATLIPC